MTKSTVAGIDVGRIGKVVLWTTILMMAILIAAIFGKAQNNIGMWQVGGTWTHVRVLNTTDAPVIPTIGDHKFGGVLRKEGIYEMKYGYGWQGNVAVTADVCTGRLEAEPIVSAPPSWARPFLQNYATLSVTELRKGVEAAKRSLRDRPGRKLKEKELDGWFWRVKKYGVETTIVGCTNSVPLVYTVDVTQWGYARTITVLVKSGPNGYYLQPSY